jgi:hypothetical protein
MFIFIYHYIWMGAYNAVKTALVETVYSDVQRVIAIVLIISILLLELLHSNLTIELSNLNVYTYDKLQLCCYTIQYNTISCT